uniref:LO7 n=1 Tax=Swordtail adomavirus 1 TaxID=2609876 RepID=A0A6F9FAD2_9VIRU|nr:TPA_asm: LO7 [Swordtail adomavirus 1]
MTTTDEGSSFDQDLSLALQENQQEFHIAGTLTSAVHTREGTVVGPSPVAQLRQQGTSEIVIELECPKDEAILIGSIVWEVEGRVNVYNAANASVPWQVAAGPAEGTVQFSIGANAATTPVRIPPFVVNAQFTQIDLQIGHTASLNKQLAQVSASEVGAGGLAILQAYLNETHEQGFYCIDDTYAFTQVQRINLQSTKTADNWHATERVHHQINCPYNMLCSWDYDDHHVRKILPRGLSLKVRAATRPYNDRCLVAVNHDNTLRAFIEVTNCTIKYSTVTVPPEHRDAEPIDTHIATVDMSIRTYDLLAQTARLSVAITTATHEFVPQFIMVFVAPAATFSLLNMHDSAYCLTAIKKAIRSARCNLNGDMTPEFMAMYQDSCINMGDHYQRSTMVNAFLGRIGFLPGRSRKHERSTAEAHLMTYSEHSDAQQNQPSAQFGCEAVLILTDPSMALIREASSGALTGKLQLKIEFDPAKIDQNHKLVVVMATKQQIGLTKVKELPGAAPVYMVNKVNTRPAFTQSDVVAETEMM